MKKFNRIWMWMAIATASFSFTSCDDDDYWHDDYYWYDDYNHGGWGWNQGDWNNGSNGSQDDYLLSEARTLTGDWRGSVMLSELAEDGQSRNNYSFNAEMTFYQAGDKVNSLSGNGVEVDYADDGSNETQTLKFAWYIDKNGDIYIRYNDSDTLFIVKGGTIDPVGSESNLLGWKKNGASSETKKPGYIPIPKYFFVAVLKKEFNKSKNQYTYSAFGYWFLHENKAFEKGDKLGKYVVNIKTLEDKTGIDFFCNLPDEIEKDVENEDAEALKKLWGFK